MNMSPTITKLAAALAKAQPLIEGASKDKNNPAFRSKYADLASVTEAIGPALAANGLSYVQISHDKENAATIETIILHESGEWMGCGPVSVPVTKSDAHGFGSALTYARRYSLAPAFGVVPEDDDGNAAAKNPPAAVPKAAKPPTKPTAEMDAKVADWCAAIEVAPNLDELRTTWEKATAEVAPWDLPMLVNLIDAAKNQRGRELVKKAA